jgi:hypothetical protein
MMPVTRDEGIGSVAPAFEDRCAQAEEMPGSAAFGTV